MNSKKGAMAIPIAIMLILAVIAGVLLVGAYSWLGGGEKSIIGKSGGDGVASLSCPDDGGTTATITLFNGLNTTGSESFDAGYRVYEANGAFFTSGTDTTSGSLSLNCGESYKFHLLSADGADNAGFISAEGGDAVVSADGRSVEFTAAKDQMTLNFYGSEHGVLEFKAYDNNNAGYMCYGGATPCTSFQTDGVTFTSTTNGTALAVGDSGEVDMTLDVRTTLTDREFANIGGYIAVEAATATWEEPVISVDGKRLTDMKGQLDVSASRALSNYEYVFKLPSGIDRSGVEVDFFIEAVSGVNPTTDIEIDFLAVGSVKETSGSGMLYGTHQDDSSNTVLFAIQDVTVDIN